MATNAHRSDPNATTPKRSRSWSVGSLSFILAYSALTAGCGGAPPAKAPTEAKSESAGCAAIEEAAKKAGYKIEVPFSPGRTDATQEMTDVESFAVLEPQADGFRNFVGAVGKRNAPELLVDKADSLGLTAAEMTVLLGGFGSSIRTTMARKMAFSPTSLGRYRTTSS